MSFFSKQSSYVCKFFVLFFCFVLPSLTLAAQNIILIIGDGMGMGIVNATRIYKMGVSGRLQLESFPIFGMATTYSHNDFVTDSAAAGTALATGFKTDNGVIGMGPADKHGARAILENLAEKAKAAGKKVAVVTNTRITDATPASFYAHIEERGEEEKIAAQLRTSKLDLILGGGLDRFHPTLLDELQNKDNFCVLKNLSDIKDCRPESRVLGLFANEHLPYEIDRKENEPSLLDLVKLAQQLLTQNSPQGYFLMVEGGKIDKAEHSNSIVKAIEEMFMLDHVIGHLRKSTNDKDTLIVVTADHDTGGLSLNGYSSEIRHNGKALVEKKNEAIAWGSGPTSGSVVYLKESAAHTGVDVGIFASGPSENMFKGFLDNTQISKSIASLFIFNK